LVRSRLDAHTLDRLAPVGETPFTESTDLEHIGGARRQVFNRNRLTNRGDSDLRSHRECLARDRRRVLNFTGTRAEHRLDNRQQFTRFALIKTINHRLIGRLQ
jgi:hypothetical protein